MASSRPFQKAAFHPGESKSLRTGNLGGYGPFLASSGADEGDILIVDFDLAERTALLWLGDDEDLEKLSP
jgi:hypothetical protein